MVRIKQLNLNSPVFAEKGHREATLVEICERANANIAAANHYFRDEATLYAEAWRMCVIEAPRSKLRRIFDRRE